MSAWKTGALLAPVLAAGGLAGALVWFSRRWIVSPRVIFEPPREEYAEPVTFRTGDGIDLYGWLLHGEPDYPAVILCHGYQRSMEEPFGLAVDLRERGFTVLLFDFRGCGRSGGRYTTIGHHEPEDLIAAVSWLRRRLGPGVPIGVHGISMGGSVAISAAARTPEIAAVVADSAFAHLSGCVELRFSVLRGLNLYAHQATMRIAERLCNGRVAHVRPVDRIDQIAPRPIFLIHGGRDDIVPISHADELFDAAGEPKQRWILPEGSHAMARLDASDEYLKRTIEFFESSLMKHMPARAVG
jgi:fermentation-respiration switch protein FrsA (DUF1100 family)